MNYSSFWFFVGCDKLREIPTGPWVMSERHPTDAMMRFGAFEVDLRAGEPRKHGIRIKLQDQPFRR